MSLRINQNIDAFNAYRNLTATDGQMSKSLEKLSSGCRINRAADDAAGLSISEGLRSQVGGLKVAVRNAQDGISVVQTAEGALTEVHSMLQRMRDLAVQASNSGGNGGHEGEAVAAAKAEFDKLADAIDSIATTTSFNGTQLLDGTSSLSFQVGAKAGQTVSVGLKDMQTSALGSGTTIDSIDFTSSATAASEAITSIDNAINSVSSFRADLGAAQNQLEHTIANVNVAIENLSASESRIRDTDMAS